ncbi:MAG: hypothetical protein JKY56_27755 [Kofleriaceae bacterium]|nr:hypothetical protein [Kofleriaceae bacterium]
MMRGENLVLIAGITLALAHCGGKEEKAVEPRVIPAPASVTRDVHDAAGIGKANAGDEASGDEASDAADDAGVSALDASIADTAGEAAANDKDTNSSKRPSKPKKHKISDLAGMWTGSAIVPSYGVVLATVRLNKKGKGSYSAKISGFTKTGSVQVVSWNGKSIRARGGGMVRSVPAKLSGNKLTLQLPLVGKVIVYR